MSTDIEGLSKLLGHHFSDSRLLQDAVTHPSVLGLKSNKATEPQKYAYERLEFLGDRVLGLVMAEWLLERFPSENEGDIAKRHAALVRRETLDRVADKLKLGQYIRVVDGDKTSIRINRNVLSDACEAILGALYIDGGLLPVKQLIRSLWEPFLSESTTPPLDPKTRLQEWLLARAMPLPVYEVVHQEGPPHAPIFEIRVSVGGKAPSATAKGPSKKDAEKIAALELYQRLEGSTL